MSIPPKKDSDSEFLTYAKLAWSTVITTAFLWLSASPFSTLNFWAKGFAGGEQFDIALQDGAGQAVSYPVGVLSTDWAYIQVPLEPAASTGVDVSSLGSIYFIHGPTPSSKSVCIDDIKFSP